MASPAVARAAGDDPATLPPAVRGEPRDRRGPSVIGRHARLELTFRQRRGRTVLADSYAEPPFRIGRGFDLDGALYLIIVCAGPGVFAGDDLRQMVTVERGARVLIASQSALQVHPGPAAQPARVEHRYVVEDEGELHCHWDPTIPFAGARVVQTFDLRLATAGRLSWSDALMAGRCSRGEAWRFRAIAHELRLSVGGSLQYLERYSLGDGSLGDGARSGAASGRVPDAPWMGGDANYFGTSLVYHAGATAALAGQLQDGLNGIQDVRAGVDLVEPGLLVGRLLSPHGASFARARSAVRDAVLAAVFNRSDLVARR